MRRMITTKLLDWAKKLFNNVQTDGTKTEVGGDLEIDGKLYLNGNVEPGVNFGADLGTPEKRFNSVRGHYIIASNRVSGTNMGDDVAQEDFCTPTEGVSLNNFSVVRMGKILYCDFTITNNSGATIANLNPYLIIKEAYRPTHNHDVLQIRNDGTTVVIGIYSNGRIVSGAVLNNGQNIHLCTFYKIA